MPPLFGAAVEFPLAGAVVAFPEDEEEPAAGAGNVEFSVGNVPFTVDAVLLLGETFLKSHIVFP